MRTFWIILTISILTIIIVLLIVKKEIPLITRMKENKARGITVSQTSLMKEFNVTQEELNKAIKKVYT